MINVQHVLTTKHWRRLRQLPPGARRYFFNLIENIVFEDKGENYFRSIEQEEFFKQVDKFDLIALGGGAVENNEIYQHILKSGKAIYLETENKPPQSHIWFKTKEEIRANTPLKHQLLAFASDYSLLLSATLPHRKDFESQKIYYASLDHAPYVSLL